ncbi:hypothetical protein [Pseudonocardia sp. ICBG601]|uniref:hypothetical protein n=1 Tax=Pseudonocardia sp. ICBG601 TaxID=2846759 RepID=UPI001CF6401C|nr:hypothetical protein [Pseudonocardia sp. ICBG601]
MSFPLQRASAWRRRWSRERTSCPAGCPSREASGGGWLAVGGAAARIGYETVLSATAPAAAA